MSYSSVCDSPTIFIQALLLAAALDARRVCAGMTGVGRRVCSQRSVGCIGRCSETVSVNAGCAGAAMTRGGVS